MAFVARYTLALCVATIALSVSKPSLSAESEVDPPSRVGRISATGTGVQFYQDASEGWQPAKLNMPVTSENSLWTQESRAEVKIGASVMRIDSESVLDFVRIVDDHTAAFLQRGSAAITLRPYGRTDFQDRVEMETDQGRFELDSPGRYRLDVNPTSRESRLTVYAGRATFLQGQIRVSVDTGRELQVRTEDHALGPQLRFFQPTRTPLDDWADERDAQWDRVHTRYASQTTVSPYMTGYDDLDEYGEWIEEREYGRVWIPRGVLTTWAPYRDGHWTYVRHWGWTWVDDAPWGFAPFHYGRWVNLRGRWCWSPGAYVARPVYAPALVAWLGTPGVGIRVASGPGVGWFPLGPREHYVPHYAHSANYVQRINHVDRGHFNPRGPAQYINRGRGTTVVSNDVFLSGTRIGGNISRSPISHNMPITTNAPLPTNRLRVEPPQLGDRRANGTVRPSFEMRPAPSGGIAVPRVLPTQPTLPNVDSHGNANAVPAVPKPMPNTTISGPRPRAYRVPTHDGASNTAPTTVTPPRPPFASDTPQEIRQPQRPDRAHRPPRTAPPRIESTPVATPTGQGVVANPVAPQVESRPNRAPQPSMPDQAHARKERRVPDAAAEALEPKGKPAHSPR